MKRATATVVCLVALGLLAGCNVAPAPQQPAAPSTGAGAQATQGESASAKTSGVAKIATASVKTTVTGGAPKVFSPEPVFEFGIVDNEEKVVHDFIIKNIGSALLELGQVKSSCGCTVAKLKDKTLAPGEETRVTATLSLKGKLGKISKVITLESNDPETASYQLQLRGTATTAFTVEPRILQFGRIVDDEIHRSTVTVRTTQAKTRFNIASAELNLPEFETEIKEIEAGKHYEIIVSNKESLKEGNKFGQLVIKMDNAKRTPLRVAVTASVVGPVYVVPSQVTLRPSGGGGADMQSVVLHVYPGRTQDFAITEVITPSDEIVVKLQQRPKSFDVALSNIPVTASLDGKFILLKTDIPGKPEVKVPIRILAPPRAASVKRPTPVVTRPTPPVRSAAKAAVTQNIP